MAAVNLERWGTSVVKKGFEKTLKASIDATPLPTSAKLIGAIASALTKHAKDLDRSLLSKSLQETLLFCVGGDPDLTHTQFKTRMNRFLKLRSSSYLVQRFLYLHFFNVIWFETAASFREAAASAKSFEQDMQLVEWACRRIVASVWRRTDVVHRGLNRSTIEELIERIEHRIQGPR